MFQYDTGQFPKGVRDRSQQSTDIINEYSTCAN
jgi:hypothetical protein